MKGDWAYTATTRIFVPDIRLHSADMLAGWTFVPLRGHGYVVAVLDIEGRCVGYADCVDFGYSSAKALAATQDSKLES